ncbi:hypothetical protein Ancab_026098 [Ancistrocladus abbreviatus]
MGGCSSSQTGQKARGKRGLNSSSPQPLTRKSASAREQPTFLSATTVKVVDMEGGVREFEPPISAGKVVSTTNPNCFLCSWETMLIDTLVQRVAEEVELQPAHLYFLMPISLSKKPLSLKDLCVLAINASSKLSIHDFQLSRRRYSI